MRALAVALLLSVPLSAGDPSSLEKAVALFRSPDAGKRAVGSQLAERELRGLLAPLLEALKDDDPEVRRRARRSILSLVPGEAEKEEKAEKSVMVAVIGLGGGAGGAFRGRRGFRRLVEVVRAQPQPLQPTQKQRADLTRKGERLLAGLGLQWKVQWRAPLMPGFRVHEVEKESQAARLGLRKGDLLVRINGEDVTGMRGVPAALDWGRVTVTVYRNARYVRLPQK
ncbi:MAG: PDZ domain-containing protein [Planctomycetota bacterium]|jgi:hypothetical protein